MNPFARLARNSLWVLIARAGAQGSAVVVTYLLARHMGTAGFGEYAFIATAIVIGNTLTTFGTDMYLIREVAANSDFSELPSVLILQLILSLLFIGLLFLLAPFLTNQTPESILALKVYGFALIPLAFFTVFTSALRGAQKMTGYASLNLFISILQVIAIFVLIQRGTGIVALAYLLLAVQFMGALAGGILCVTTIPRFWQGWHVSSARPMPIFVVCLPIALIAITGIIYQKLSLAMLSLVGSASMVGLFSAAARVMEATRLGHFAAFTALYPAMTNGDQESHQTLRVSGLALLTISVGGSILIYLLAKPVVYFFFGEEYQSSIPVLKVLAFTLIPYTANSFLSLMFLAQKKEKVVLRVFVTSLLILLTMNLWLVPLHGEVGAGWATLIAEVLQAILFLWVLLNSPFRQMWVIDPKGVSYELSDPS